MHEGPPEWQLVTECSRCRVPNRNGEIDLKALMSRVESLGPVERKVFAQWIEKDQRSFTILEQLWGNYRTLPERSRACIKQATLGKNE
jgi:hypothetical protein